MEAVFRLEICWISSGRFQSGILCIPTGTGRKSSGKCRKISGGNTAFTFQRFFMLSCRNRPVFFDLDNNATFHTKINLHLFFFIESDVLRSGAYQAHNVSQFWYKEKMSREDGMRNYFSKNIKFSVVYQ